MVGLLDNIENKLFGKISRVKLKLAFYSSFFIV